MAKNYSEIYSAVYDKKNKMDFSNSMIRGNGIPLDITEVYNSLNAAISYAASNPVAYEGQLLAVTENGDTNVYVIGPKSQGTVTINGVEVVNYLKLVGKETDLSNYYTKEQVDALIPETPEIPNIEIVDDEEAEVSTEETVNVYKNLTASGHKLTEELVQVVTPAGLKKVKDDLEKKITAGMSFKGTVEALPLQAEVGDTYKVYGSDISIEIDGVKAQAGDTIIYGVDDESLSTHKWYLIPSGDDIEDTWRPVEGVGSDKSLAFSAGAKLKATVGEDGKIEYSHETVDAPSASNGEGRTYITEIETDGYGHITGYKTATEIDQEIPEDTNTTYDLSVETTDGKADIKLTSSEEGASADAISMLAGDNITITKKSDNSFEIAATDSTYTAGNGLDLNEGAFSIVIDETDETDEGYLSVTNNGLKISGVNKAISDAIEEYKQTIPEDSNTTYDLTAAVTEGQVDIKLTGSNTTEDIISIIKGNNINILDEDGKIKIEATDTTYDAGNGLALNESSFSVKSADSYVLVTENGVSIGSTPVYETVDGKKNLKTAGTGIFVDVYSKEETLDKIAEKITEINGGESAGEVLSQLNSYKEVTDPRLALLEDYVKYSEDISIVDREVEVDGATVTKKAYKVDYNVNNLTQNDGDWLILNCGNAGLS